MKSRLSMLAILMVLAVLSASTLAVGAAVPYCNITNISYKQLSNGVQITIEADGVLEAWDEVEGNVGQEAKIRLNNAKSLLDSNFIEVGTYPVSHMQLCMPQDAKEGVGLDLIISNYTSCEFHDRYSNDRTSYFVTVYSERTLEGNNNKAAAEDTKPAEELSVEFSCGLLTVRCIKQDIHHLLGLIADKTGLNLALDDAVRREVSLNLVNLSPDKVIEGIAGAYGLALSKEQDVYLLSEGIPTDLSSYRLSGTASFPLQYTRASEASGLLPTFLYSYLHVNQPQNALVVSAPRQMLDKIATDLDKVDIAPPQILIEALAVEFSSTQDIDRVVEARAGDITSLGDSELQAYSDSRTGEIHYSTLSQLPSDFEARLKNLEQQGRARIRAAPRMAAMNGYTADFFVGLRRFIRVEYLIGGLTQEQIQGVDVGVKLEVTPWTGGNGEITVKVEPEVSNIAELDLQTGLPVLATRSASTTVRVKDGQTILIGGLKQKQTFDVKTKIPLLGDLPLVGGLFRSRAAKVTDTELVIFITPHILTPEGRLANGSREGEIRQRFLYEQESPLDARPL